MILLITSNSHRAQVRIYEEWEEHPMVGAKEHWIQMFGSCTKQASSPLDGLPPQTLPPPPCPNMWGHSRISSETHSKMAGKAPSSSSLLVVLWHRLWELHFNTALPLPLPCTSQFIIFTMLTVGSIHICLHWRCLSGPNFLEYIIQGPSVQPDSIISSSSHSTPF